LQSNRLGERANRLKVRLHFLDSLGQVRLCVRDAEFDQGLDVALGAFQILARPRRDRSRGLILFAWRVLQDGGNPGAQQVHRPHIREDGIG
jgi:hypothetical protein